MSAVPINGGGEGISQEQEDVERGRERTEEHPQLYKAALKGDWGTACKIYEAGRNKANSEITKKGETVLHIAAMAGQTHFVEKLVRLMSEEGEEGLLHTTKKGDTAFHFAVTNGDVKLAKATMEEEFEIPLVFPNGESLLRRAAFLGHHEMVRFLFNHNKNKLSDEDRKDLLVPLIEADMYDIAWEMLQDHPNLAAAGLEGAESLEDTQDNPMDGTNATVVDAENERVKTTPLLALARKYTPTRKNVFQSWTDRLKAQYTELRKPPSKRGFSDVEYELKNKDALKILQCIWKEITLRDRESGLDDFHFKPIFWAAEQGNVKFLKILMNDYPDILFKTDENGRTIFHIAVLNRRKKILKLIDEFGAVKNLIATYTDTDGNNILHLAGKLAPSGRLGAIPGAALQLQSEINSFEEDKNAVQPWLAEAKNKEGLTPRDLFEREHKDLMMEATKWIIRTADSCTVVAALIATVAFAAAFTFPGGNQDTGIPVFFHKTSFKVFVIFNALSFILSITSLAYFLLIHMSRFTLDDFHKSLPEKLGKGLDPLLSAVISLMVAFVAAFFVVFNDERLLTISIFIAVLSILMVSEPVVYCFRICEEFTMGVWKKFSMLAEEFFP